MDCNFRAADRRSVEPPRMANTLTKINLFTKQKIFIAECNQRLYGHFIVECERERSRRRIDRFGRPFESLSSNRIFLFSALTVDTLKIIVMALFLFRYAGCHWQMAGNEMNGSEQFI